MGKPSKNRIAVRTLTQFSLLLAIEIVLGVTPLGLIMIPPIAITLMHIPVIICAVVMGPLYGGLLGLSFGLISMFKAISSAVSPGDIMFNPAMSGNPVASVVLCILPRVLLGVVAALLFRALSKVIQKPLISVGISAVLATLFHTVSVLGLLYAFFTDSSFIAALKNIFAVVISFNGILEIIAAILVAVPVSIPLLKYNGSHKGPMLASQKPNGTK